jgi:putative DNA primase/helicase
LAWIASERPRLVAACLTLLRAYHIAGRPAHPHPPKGSFEAWDALIRGALIWAGVGDAPGGQDRIREESDSDLDALRAGLVAWVSLFGHDRATAADAIKHAANDPEARSGLALFAGCDESKLDARRLGYPLRGFKNRLCDGRRFVREGQDRIAGIRWSVRENG